LEREKASRRGAEDAEERRIRKRDERIKSFCPPGLPLCLGVAESEDWTSMPRI
jgi:hypothetical protein